MKEIEILQEENISINDKYIENNDINFLDISFEKEMDLEYFLSKKIEGLLETDNLTDYYDKREKESQEILDNKNNTNEKEEENIINKKGSEEIINIFRRAWGDKKSPFKRLMKPKKLSLNGRILYNISLN